MRVQQVSVFLENRPGRLAHLLQVLEDADINIRAISIAETADFGIVRLLLPDTRRSLEAIRAAGMTARVSEVLPVNIDDKPGSLLENVVKPLADAGINIEYLYAFASREPGRATIVLKVDNIDKAEEILGG